MHTFKYHTRILLLLLLVTFCLTACAPTEVFTPHVPEDMIYMPAAGSFTLSEMEIEHDVDGIYMTLEKVYAANNGRLFADVIWHNNTGDLLFGDFFTFYYWQDDEWANYDALAGFDTIGYPVNGQLEKTYPLWVFARRLRSGWRYKIAAYALELQTHVQYNFSVAFTVDDFLLDPTATLP